MSHDEIADLCKSIDKPVPHKDGGTCTCPTCVAYAAGVRSALVVNDRQLNQQLEVRRREKFALEAADLFDHLDLLRADQAARRKATTVYLVMFGLAIAAAALTQANMPVSIAIAVFAACCAIGAVVKQDNNDDREKIRQADLAYRKAVRRAV
jgi:hypothetical protein